jgi:hypothetical protein
LNKYLILLKIVFLRYQVVLNEKRAEESRNVVKRGKLDGVNYLISYTNHFI